MSQRRRLWMWCVGLMVAGWFWTPALAQADQILTIRSQLSDRILELTVAELNALPQAEIVTTNDFVDHETEFRGPRVDAVIALLGEPGASTARMVAMNDSAVVIGLDELAHYGAILAMEMDGNRLSRRGKGPIWVIYPTDDHPELQDQAYNTRLIWQLTEIELQ